MGLLVGGILVFVILHLIPVFPDIRSQLNRKLSPAIYKLVFSLLSLFSMVLIVSGLKASPFVPVYKPPDWGHTAALVLILPALYLFFSTSMGPAPSSAKVISAHPMNWGVITWSVAHLLANGDLAHVLLFGALGVYSAISIVSGNARGMVPKLSARPALTHELAFLAIVLLIYLGIFFLHPVFTGMSLI